MTTENVAAGPSGVPVRPIHERQLDDDLLLLQRAASTSHRRGQIIEAVRNTLAIMLAAGGLVVTFLGHGRNASAICGFIWFLISAFILKSWASSTAREGALLQEAFDTTLFQMPWRHAVAGDPVADHDVFRLARGLKPGGTRDRRITSGWYDPTNGVHHPHDVLIAQDQNLAWDARLRRIYSNWVATAAILWAAIGFLAGLLTGAAVVQTLLSFFIPSLAAVQLAHEIWAGQRRVANERDRLSGLVQTELRKAQPGPIDYEDRRRLCEITRDIQDGIFRTRLDAARVPEWFYRRHRDADERDFASTAEGHRRRLAG
ncbi:S-4TM family putative pore-forming effector [Micromonospora sp. NPDC049801]|uniref:S-4TM family putative pore-forming effector n=1 Tax=unclassified Micromonospora TaxID=2617518 RepID=UPI0034073612